MNTTFLVVYCTCPSPELAERIAEVLVDEGLAACVNILPGITSVYRWQGSIQRDHELLLIIKTRSDAYPTLEARIRQLHSYAVPEIIALPIVQGHRHYLEWIDSSLGSPLASSDDQGEPSENTG